MTTLWTARPPPTRSFVSAGRASTEAAYLAADDARRPFESERAADKAPAYEAVAQAYGDLWWGQKALWRLLALAEEAGDAAAADGYRVRLLATPLGDVERQDLLSARLRYLEPAGQEAQAVANELTQVKARLQQQACCYAQRR